MDKIRKSFRSRKKNDRVPESSKPHQWQEDERKVREGCCSFQVKYLGCHEVFESRGIQVCEDAVKVLKAKSHRSVWSRMSMRKRSEDKAKGKSQRAILYVSGDALRVVDEISKGLIVDQTIEKVSFCAPDRNNDKAFAYICRDGTTRRWLCHAFLAVKETGERLSHAVGCAFAICLEKKQKREKDAVQVTFNAEGTSFTRTGSFRPATLTERLADPQSTILADPVPKPSQAGVVTTASVERPHATDNMLQKQASFRGFNKLSQSLPFKRQASLRLGELPSTLERQQAMWTNDGFQQQQQQLANGRVSPILESPTAEEESINAASVQLSQGLAALSADDSDPFSNAPFGNTATAQVHASSNQARTQPSATNGQVSNPFTAQSPDGIPDADKWLHSVASSVSSQRATQQPAVAATVPAFFPAAQQLGGVYPAQVIVASPFVQQHQAVVMPGQPVYPGGIPIMMVAPQPQPAVAVAATAFNPVFPPLPPASALAAAPVSSSSSAASFVPFGTNWSLGHSVQPQSPAASAAAASARLPMSTLHTTAHGTNGAIVSVSSGSNVPVAATSAAPSTHAPHLSQQTRSHTIDVAAPAAQSTWTSFNGNHAIGPTTLDPFDVAWAAKASGSPSVPANNTAPLAGATTSATTTRSFHVNL